MSGALVLLLAAFTSGEKYSNVASMFDFGMGARPLAMGGAFVGLADDGNALFYNPAGLAWAQGLSVLSSYEARPGTTSYGSLSASLPHFGFGVHYFDFGDVPETDEFGNVVGTFSYRNYALVAGAGLKASEIPGLGAMPWAGSIGIGLSMKALRVSSLEPGSGSGMAFDIPFLFCMQDPSSRLPFVRKYSVGLVFENLIGIPIEYGSGHHESWPRSLVFGTSIDLLDQLTVALDLTSDDSLRLGVEWTPFPALSLRGGLCRNGVWMESLGVGTRIRGFALDLALVFHPYLTSQLRGSLAVSW